MVNFHIEATSKCTLECPLCDRTWFYQTFKKRLIHEIKVNELVKFLGHNKEINFCGNNGDPIYHSQFIEMCIKLKKNNCKLFITTNGSARSISWWKKLNSVLDENDQITLSIDGLEDTNHIYRRNSNWGSIMKAINVLQKRKCKLKWKFIVFKHNQHQIQIAKEKSQELKFDQFGVEHSHRWLADKTFIPDTEYTNPLYVHQEKVLEDQNYIGKMRPMCLINGKPENSLYIDAEGNFYPCCWIGSYRYKFKTTFSPKNNDFNIRSNTLEKILSKQSVKDFFQSTKAFTSANECCKMHCGVKNG